MTVCKRFTYLAPMVAGLCGLFISNTIFGQQPPQQPPFFSVVDTHTTAYLHQAYHQHYYTKSHSKTGKTEYTASSRFPSMIQPVGVNVFVFNPKILSWAAYDANGQLIKTGKASGGRKYCPDIHRGCRTPVGDYTVYAKGGADCISHKFPIGRGGAPMPYCAYFSGGYAIHGSYEVPNYNASHGCIRVIPSSAKWLEGFLHTGTRVIVDPY